MVSRKKAILWALPLVVLFAAQWALEASHSVPEPSHLSHHRHAQVAFHAPQDCDQNEHDFHCCVHSQGWVLSDLPELLISEMVYKAILLPQGFPSRGSFELFSLRGPPFLS